MTKVIFMMQAYNAERTLRRAVDSVLSQSCGDFVFHLYDNASLDNTADIVREYAKTDSRIAAHFEKTNEPLLTLKHTPEIVKRNPTADFISYLDADDEYHPDFLAKILAFAARNQLDIAAAGSDFIAADTGKVLRQNISASTIIIERRDFAAQFINWRKFHTTTWGKLFKISNAVRNIRNVAPVSLANGFKGGDMEFNITMIKAAKRIGILDESLHNYYVYGNSTCQQFFSNVLDNHKYVYELYRELLGEFGEVCKLNSDYLYAIWLGFMEEELQQLVNSCTDTIQKQRHALKMLNQPITREMLACNPDPQFRNLANRAEFPLKVEDALNLHDMLPR